jgi:hypothetical protein
VGSTFGLAFCISHFIFFLFCFVHAPAKSKGQLLDEELATIPSRICHFLMQEYISPRGVFHTPETWPSFLRYVITYNKDDHNR